MTQRIKLLLLSGIAIQACTFSTTAIAQAKPAQGGSGDEVNPSSEIIVTARRTAENIQSVAVSATAFNGDSLTTRSIKTTEDLQLATPGVFLSGNGGRQNVNYSIRGQSKAVSGLSSPGVVSYFADVPDPVQGSATPQYDMGSVQILKGPQGTLFGRNTTGGAVLFYPATPKYEFSGYVEAAYGTFNNRQFQGVLNVPLVTDKVAIRFAGDYQKRDGYTKQIGAGGDLDNINSRAFRVSLRLDPVDGLTNTTIFDYYKNDDNGQSTILTALSKGPDTLDALGLRTAMEQQLALQRARGPFVIDNSIPQSQSVLRKSLINRTEIQIGGAKVTNIFGFRSTHWQYLVDADGVPYIQADGTGLYPAGVDVEYLVAGASNNTHQYSDELQLNFKALNDNLDVLVGGFYLRSTPSGPNASIARALQLVGIQPNAASNLAFLTETSKALFGHFSYKFGSGFSLDAGFRYSWDNFRSCTASGKAGLLDDVNPDGCVNTNPLVFNASANSTGSSAPTWTVGLNWQVNPKLFTYIVTRRGYRSGGINSPTLAGRLIPYQSWGPETVTDIEAGVRSDWDLGGDTKLRFNLSGYSGWYNNVQSALTGLRTQASCNPAIVNPPGVSPDGDCDKNNDPAALTMIANIGKSQVSGIDMDGILWVDRHLVINFGGSYMSPRTRAITAGSALLPYIQGGGIPFRNTPKFTWLAGVSYTADLPGNVGEVVARADYYHNGKVLYSTDEIPAYDVVNARLEWNKVLGSSFDLAVFARNLFNAKYIASTNLSTASIFALTTSYGVPRTVGVSLRYKFGS